MPRLIPRTLSLFLGALVTLPAAAQNAPLNHAVMLEAKKCLKVPGVMSYGSYRASMVVTLDGGIPTEVRTAELDPPGSSGRSLVKAATSAIVRCAPYPSAEDGTHMLVFESEE